MNLLPMTELEAVNLILETSGESPVNSLITSGVSEVSIAQDILHNTSRNYQARGLYFNTEYKYPLSLDTDGNIYLPYNTIKVDPIDRTKRIIQRGTRLYDLENHTYIFTEVPEVEITFFLPFDELPQPVRNYVTVVAGREFQRKVVGSETINKLTEEDEMKALIAVQEYEDDTADYSIYDNYYAARVINRNYNPYPVGAR